MITMSNITVQQISIVQPIKAVGKNFTGDYRQSFAYIKEVQTLLDALSVKWIPNKVLGIYYDHPAEKKAEDLQSFQGVFTENEQVIPTGALSTIELAGSFLYTIVSGDPTQTIGEGYAALFEYVGRHAIKLKSNAGIQIVTLENGMAQTEIYLEL
ncbi:AraC family transcriptional regulator [Chryseolinea soli]|uniref:AraC family transcriptional regulator n=2 Tax=Chryseolinea soli TaxID=2321403 RepID=A0A385SLC5_9BACT|nr:AraC family transcriptional regulator [Chryseolinea soli]